ncbi:hypothetical protein [Rhodococcus pyridinivorans]|uniref:hypothetical protein n=1 Tax=Rhodococcus pyridinivorans TaxID=103816 RepID=UPI00228474BF|nr:hypothetical protein [Rhodococcus pyridinivorans]WAL49561.1 hypothetical protein OQN32_27545 [Rhodococcus pyridinivorans]
MIRKLLTITAATAALTLGSVGVASADAQPPFGNPPSHMCDFVGGQGTFDCFLLTILTAISTGSANSGSAL